MFRAHVTRLLTTSILMGVPFPLLYTRAITPIAFVFVLMLSSIHFRCPHVGPTSLSIARMPFLVLGVRCAAEYSVVSDCHSSPRACVSTCPGHRHRLLSLPSSSPPVEGLCLFPRRFPHHFPLDSRCVLIRRSTEMCWVLCSLYSSPGQVVVVLYVRIDSFISINCRSVERTYLPLRSPDKDMVTWWVKQ
jgi:hypothetical protein